MSYKKLIIILVCLIIIYCGLELLKNYSNSEQHPKQYVFPEKLDGFLLKEKNVETSSNSRIISLWCASGKNCEIRNNFELIYKKDNTTLSINIYIPKNKNETMKCFNSNSKFFSNQKNITYENITNNAFFIEGFIFSAKRKMMFLLDENYDYIIVESENLEKENMKKLATRFLELIKNE